MHKVAEARGNSRQKIIDTALKLFSQQGFEKTSVREIAKAAEVSLGLMYNYFDSKELLLKAIFQESIRDIQQSFTIKNDNPAQLALLLRKYFHSIENMKDHWRLLHSIRMQQHLQMLLAQETEIISNYMIGELSLVLKHLRYQQPLQEAVLLFAAMDGLANHYLANSRYPLDKMVDLLVSKYAYH